MKTIAWSLLALSLLAATAFADDDIKMKPVKSSLIAKIGYDPQSKTLAVQMNNSSDMYLYEGVPMSLYDDFLAADSKGAFFVKHVKGKFGHDREK